MGLSAISFSLELHSLASSIATRAGFYYLERTDSVLRFHWDPKDQQIPAATMKTSVQPKKWLIIQFCGKAGMSRSANILQFALHSLDRRGCANDLPTTVHVPLSSMKTTKRTWA